MKTKSVTIKVRFYAGAYVARAEGKCASSTSSAMTAVNRCASKIFPNGADVIVETTGKTFVAEGKVEQ